MILINDCFGFENYVSCKFLFLPREEAVAALNEAIMVAQEVNDNVCLQYSLVIFYIFS